MTELLNSILFSQFCSVLADIKRADSKKSKESTIKNFYHECLQKCKDESDFLKQLEPLVLLFLPDSNDRIKFDMGHKRLMDSVTRAFDIPDLQIDSNLDPNNVTEILTIEISKRLTLRTSKLTILQFYNYIVDMNNAKGKERDQKFLDLVEHLDEQELIWLLNILIRNIEKYAGYTRNMFLSHLSPNANTTWQITRDLRSVLVNKFDDEDREPDFYLGNNFSPMLLARLTCDLIDSQMKNLYGGFFMETKYDGEHVLLHKNKDEYKWYTRNGKDFSMRYGCNKNEKLAAQIHSCFKSAIDQCIIDCELMHYDESRGKLVRHLDRGSDGVVLNYSNPQPGHRIVVVVFDLLYISGTVHGNTYKEDLTITPLVDRAEIMRDRLLKTDDISKMFLVPRKEGETAEDIRECFKNAMELGEEGIAIKRKDSLYHIGKRNKGNGWFKLKDRFDMDLVIVGLCPAQDDKGLSFLLAAWDDTTYHNKFLHVICKSYSGLSALDRRKILQDVRENGPLLKEPPNSLIGWSDPLYEYFRESDWLVVEAVAHGVRNGHLVDTVMQRIRYDKEVCKEDIDEYRVIKKYNPAENNFNNEVKTKAIKKKKMSVKDIFSDNFAVKREKLTSSDHIDLVLSGKTVCVLQGFDDCLRKKCWDILRKFGANVIANTNDDTILLIAPSEKHMKVLLAKKKGNLPIIKSDWLLRYEEKNVLEPWLESDIILDVTDGFRLT